MRTFRKKFNPHTHIFFCWKRAAACIGTTILGCRISSRTTSVAECMLTRRGRKGVHPRHTHHYHQTNDHHHTGGARGEPQERERERSSEPRSLAHKTAKQNPPSLQSIIVSAATLCTKDGNRPFECKRRSWRLPSARSPKAKAASKQERAISPLAPSPPAVLRASRSRCLNSFRGRLGIQKGLSSVCVRVQRPLWGGSCVATAGLPR